MSGYPRTDFIWEDKSDIGLMSPPPADTTDRPIFLLASTFDKGYEEMKLMTGSQFFDIYGKKPNFEKHGQPAITCANIINSGGRLLVKRVVAEDAKLANIGVVAKVKKISVQKTVNGQPIYQDANGVETVDPTGNAPVMVQKCKISYELQTVPISGNDVNTLAKTFLASNAHTGKLGQDDQYPLFIIADNGRGFSKKKFRVSLNTVTHRPVDYTKYILEILEDNEVIESVGFTLHPSIIENGKNISFQNSVRNGITQVRARHFESEIMAFIENVAYIIGDNTGEYQFADILFGTDIYGKEIDNIVIDQTVDLRNIYGTALVGGDNGMFGDKPIAATTYAAEVAKFYNGNFSDEIYDLDNYRIDFVPDANYPELVKRAIEGFVAFREDAVYLGDLGLNLRTMDEILIAAKNRLRSLFCATYHNSWEVTDPYSRKQITVTSIYSLCAAMVTHFINGRNRPFCGIKYGVVFPDIAEDMVNFIPRRTPAYDQKQTMSDNRINYASFHNGLLVMQTNFTAQTRHTQLSYLCNVLAIQHIVKDVREQCPKTRYSFADGDDLEEYQRDVNRVIEKHSHDFKSLKMIYANDKTAENNKIYYAVIEVQCRDFFQEEKFKIIALPTT